MKSYGQKAKSAWTCLYRIGVVALVLLLFCLCACAHIRPTERLVHIGQEHGYTERVFSHGRYTILGLLKAHAGKRLHVYIEGDGHAYTTSTSPSPDPTPKTPIGLWLALHDPTPAAILYLARPGQYLDLTRYPCDPAAWTHGRLHKDIVALYDAVIDQVMREQGKTELVLVGFSGGGGLAALLAAKRRDVAFLATCAGNLSIKQWTRCCDLDPLYDSLDPIDAAEALRGLPQRHYIGARDTVVPAECPYAFCHSIGNEAACLTVPAFAHTSPWHTVWDYSYSSAPQKTWYTRSAYERGRGGCCSW